MRPPRPTRQPPGPRFNPRTRKGATRLTHLGGQSLQFQSTHPQGCDTSISPGSSGNPRVSIHAPARVRHNREDANDPLYRFNPRTRKGATRMSDLAAADISVSIHAPARVRQAVQFIDYLCRAFQSTHPQGCDASCIRVVRKNSCFNPRTRKGATQGLPAWRRGRRVSIHAPARVRLRHAVVAPLAGVSIHAPARVRPTPS